MEGKSGADRSATSKVPETVPVKRGTIGANDATKGDAGKGDAAKKGRGGRGRGQRLDFATLDKNKDGKLTKDEVPERMQSFFDAIDANHDGAVSKQELDDR